MNQKHTKGRLFLFLAILIVFSGLLLPVLGCGKQQSVHADNSYSNGDPSVANGVLRSVVSLPNGEAYAAGWEGNYPGTGLIEHYINGLWHKDSLPANTDALQSIAAVSSTDLWAVGGSASPLLLHGDGSSWTPVSLPQLQGCANAGLSKVKVIANNVYAVGRGCQNQGILILRYDGSNWTVDSDIAVPTANLNDIVGNTNDLYAAGALYGGGDVVLHIDPKTLSASVLPNPQSNTHDDGLTNLAIMSDGTIWATSFLGALDRYNPATNSWNTFDTSSHPQVNLEGLAQAGDQLYAVGIQASATSSGTTYTPVGYAYDGKTWNFFTLPIDTNPEDYPLAAAVDSNGIVWVVGGSYSNFATNGVPMIWQYTSASGQHIPGGLWVSTNTAFVKGNSYTIVVGLLGPPTK